MATMLAPPRRRRKGTHRRFLTFKHEKLAEGGHGAVDDLQNVDFTASATISQPADDPTQAPSTPIIAQNRPRSRVKGTIDPNDPIWKDYVREAVDEDQDMLNAWNNDLDTLLVFSGLFSAILTAFLLESSRGLQPDPSLAIVSAIQAGFRSSNDTSSASNAAGSEPFQAEPRSVRVNALWFSSLSLSLLSAAGSMLGKSWLVAYSRQLSIGSPYQMAERRQKRFDGLQRWKFRGTMDFLPFPLFVSIILFGIGLCDFLYGLHRSIAAISTAILSLSVLFFSIVNMLRLFISNCPYHTPIPLSMPALPTVHKTLKTLTLKISRVFYYVCFDLPLALWGVFNKPGPRSWIDLPREIAVTLFVSTPSLAYHALQFLWRIAKRTSIRLYEAMLGTSSSDQTWKAGALAWLIESSSREEVVTKALHLIPAGSNGVTGSNPLCKKGVFDILLWRFLSTCEMEVDGMREDQVVILPGREAALQAYLQYLRLLFDGSAEPSTTRDYFNHEALERIVDVSQSNDLTDRVLSTSLLRSISYAVDESRWWGDILQAAHGGGLRFRKWFRPFLMRVINDEIRLSPEKGPTGLALACELINQVEIDKDYSFAFLSVLASYLGIPTPSTALAGLDSSDDPSLLLTNCLGWIQTLPLPPTQEETSQDAGTLDLCTAALLRILLWQMSEPENNVPDINIHKPFIGWVMANQTFSIHTRVLGIRALEKCLGDMAPIHYIQGCEVGIVQSCFEVVRRLGTHIVDTTIAVTATSLAIHTLFHAEPSTRLVLLEELMKPGVIPALISMLDQTADTRFSEMAKTRMIEAFVAVAGFRCIPSSIRFSIQANSPTASAESAAIHTILAALLDSGLNPILLRRFADDKPYSDPFELLNACMFMQMIASFPSLASPFISDRNFPKSLISAALCNENHVSNKLPLLGILIQLSYRVRETKNNEELRKTWYGHLVELRLLRVLATLVQTWDFGITTASATLMLYFKYLIPILQDILQDHRSAVIESELIGAMDVALRRMMEVREEIKPLGTGTIPIIRASDVFVEFELVIKGMFKLGREGKVSTAEDSTRTSG